MKKVLVLLPLLPLLFWLGCSSAPPIDDPLVKEAKVKAEEKKAEAIEELSTREPGSLWSKKSRWNDIYTTKNVRTVSSLIFIKPTKRFSKLVEERVAVDKDRREFKIEDNRYIVATIKEVLPRGVYTISSDQALVLEKEEEPMRLKAKIRERDIGSDDMISADLVFDMRMELPKVDEARSKVKAEKEAQEQKQKAKEEAKRLKEEQKASKEKASDEAEEAKAEQKEKNSEKG